MNQSKPILNYIKAVISIIVLVGLDQLSKYIVAENMVMHDYKPVFGDVFGLYYLINEGMAWGMFQQKQVFFLIFTIVFLVAAAYVYSKLLADRTFRPLNICILFLVSGAIGNMIDRMFRGEFLHGGVVDFLYIKIINFPVFNVADMYVTISISVLVILLFTKYRNVEFDMIFPSKHKVENENNKKEEDH